MKTALIAVACIVAATFWFVEKSTGANLHAQLATAQAEREERVTLRREQQRLQRLEQESREIRSPVASALRNEHTNSASAPGPETMVPGEWTPPTAWKNRGHGTAANTIETMMWAAAGGDVENLRRVLDLDEETTVKLEQLLASMPGATRAMYPTPKHLVAAFTAKAIPLGEAQVVWQQQLGPDDAVACVWAKITEQIGETNAESSKPANRTKSAFLTLRRTSEGWQIVVPLRAVESLAKELQGDAKAR